MKKLHHPKPKKLKEELGTIENVNIHRKMDCIFYEHCLDHADNFNYRGFSCGGCYYYHKGEITNKERKAFEEIAMEILKGNGVKNENKS